MKDRYATTLKIQWEGLLFHSIFSILFTSARLVAGFVNSAHSQQIRYPLLQTSNSMTSSQLLDIGGMLQVGKETRLLDDVYLEKFKDLTLPSDRYVTMGPDGKMKGGPPVETTPPGGGNGGGGMVTPGNGGGGQAGLFWKIEGNDQITSAHFFGTINNAALIFKTNNIEWFRISENGNLGIGIASPSYKLHVSGSVNASQYFLNGVLVDVNLINSNISDLQTSVGSIQSAVASQQSEVDTLQNEMLNVQSSISNVQVKITAHDSLIANLTDTVSGLKSQISNLTSSQWQNTGSNSISYNGNVAVVWNFTASAIGTGLLTISDKFTAPRGDFDTLNATKRFSVNHNLALGSDSGTAESDIASKVADLTIQSDPAATYNVVMSADNNTRVGIGDKFPSEKLSVQGNVKVSGNIISVGNITTAGTVSANTFNADKFSSDTLFVTRIIPAVGDSEIHFGENSATYNVPANRISWTQASNAVKGFAIGNVSGVGFGAIPTVAKGFQSIAIGRIVQTHINADHAIVIGSGIPDDNGGTPLINTQANSLAIGFNSNIPTLTVRAAAGLGRSGNVGVGTTNPQAILEVYQADPFSPTTVFKIHRESFFGNSNIVEITKKGKQIGDPPVTLFTIKDTGNVGVATDNPIATFDVNGTSHFGGDVGIGGNVGIGTTSPEQTLDVRSRINVRGPGNASADFTGIELINDGTDLYTRVDICFKNIGPTYGNLCQFLQNEGSANSFLMRNQQAGEPGEFLDYINLNLSSNDISFNSNKTSGATYGNVVAANGNVLVSNGKLGIGISNPKEKFQIGNNFTIHDGGNKVIARNFYFDGVDKRLTSGKVSAIYFGDGDLTFRVAPLGPTNSPIANQQGWTDALHISNTGNVSINDYNDLLLRNSHHGLGWYYNPTDNPDAGEKAFTNDNTDVGLDGPVLYGFNGGALGSKYFDGSGTEHAKIALRWDANGNIALGSCSIPSGFKFAVDGKIKAKEVEIDASNWCDYKLKPGYKRMTAEEKLAYIFVNGHLPEIDPGSEIESSGLKLSKNMRGMIWNIEDNTLDIIELYKMNEQLLKIVKKQNEEIVLLKQKLEK